MTSSGCRYTAAAAFTAIANIVSPITATRPTVMTSFKPAHHVTPGQPRRHSMHTDWFSGKFITLAASVAVRVQQQPGRPNVPVCL